MKHPLRHQFTVAVVLLLFVYGAAAIGTQWPAGEWYAAINKPRWHPPAWIFGPVWTVLYLMMAAAAWLVWNSKGWIRSMNVWLLQLALNAAWSPLFFGAKRIDWACLCIIALWFAILATILMFWKRHKLAACLMMPYLAWVSFATVLNAVLWVMNR